MLEKLKINTIDHSIVMTKIRLIKTSMLRKQKRHLFEMPFSYAA